MSDPHKVFSLYWYLPDPTKLTQKNLNLIKIIIIIISITMAVYLFAATIITQSISKVEITNLKKDLERITDIIDTQVAQLQITTDDYGNWDDTYRFAENLNQNYLTLNFTPETFKSHNIDFLWLINKQKKIITSRFYDKNTDILTDLTTQPIILEAIKQKINNSVNLSLQSNYIKTKQGLILYAISPIFNSHRQGPPRGFLAMASILDKEDEAKISKVTNINFEITSLDSIDIVQDNIKILHNNKQLFIKKIAVNLLYAYGFLQDKQGKNIALLKISDNRVIYQNGLLGLHYLKKSLILVVIMFVIISKRFLNSLEKEIKQRHKIENILKKEQQLAYTTFDSITDGIILTDAEEKVIFLNPVAEVLTGWQNYQALGQALEVIYQLIEPNDLSEAKENYQGYDRGFFEVMGEKVLISRQGTQYAINESIAVIKENDKPSGRVVVFRDVTKIRLMAHQLARQATYDPLTDLFNRQTFESHLQKALTQAKEESVNHCLGLIDLDHFKYINDTCGHLGGDQVLRQISEIFKKTIPSGHTIARLGGDEFGVIFLNCTLLEAQAIAIKLCNEVKEFCFHWENQVFRVGASIGLVAITQKAPKIETLLQEADMACYEAKEKGRGRVEVYCVDNQSHQRL